MKALIVVGLGFGDEGKGSVVDAICRHRSVDWVVRYSGGHQAGHNVVLEDGRSHTFSQFGAGTLAGVKTYLDREVIVEPIALQNEAVHLHQLGVKQPFNLLTVHPLCLVTTKFHKSQNIWRETRRGSDKHGTCGVGVGETRGYWLQHGRDALVAGDLDDHHTVVDKLRLMRYRFQEERRLAGTMDYYPMPSAEAVTKTLLPDFSTDEMRCQGMVVFEGAQGVLLDEFYGFPPHTTWGTVTAHRAEELAEEWNLEKHVIGVTRIYATRHGAGPFELEHRVQIIDPHNHNDGPQGRFKTGHLDMEFLKYAAAVASQNGIDSLAVNCLDEATSEMDIAAGWQYRWPHMPLRDQYLSLVTRIMHGSRTWCDANIGHGDKDVSLVLLARHLAPISLLGRGPRAKDKEISDELADWLSDSAAAKC